MLNILHVDIDAFYASVEELEDEKLKNHPIAVAHNSNRGIITTANYQARKYGIYSAMPVFIAKTLCPDLIIVPIHRQKYLEKSAEVFNILKKYTAKIEKVSIDEAYLEIDSEQSEKIAREILEEIPQKTGLTVSVGLSYNKFLAKIASDWNKPKGLKIIKEKDIPQILLKLDIKKVHGIGKKTEEKLRKIGINTIEDMMQLTEDYMDENFGKIGKELYHRIRGIDKRKVTTTRERKSISIERTFKPIRDKKILQEKLDKFAEELAKDMENKNLQCRTITVKLKNSEFINTTKSKTFEYNLYKKQEIIQIASELFQELYTGDKIRLIGISASNLDDKEYIQMEFL